jgi:hypothetical protein
MKKYKDKIVKKVEGNEEKKMRIMRVKWNNKINEG